MPIRFIEDQEQPASGTRIRMLEEEKPQNGKIESPQWMKNVFPSVSHEGTLGQKVPLGQAAKETLLSGIDLLSFQFDG